MPNFKRRVNKFINYTESDVHRYDATNNSTDVSLGRSFNYETVANENTKLVIVGTYTPKKGRENGYYYCSSRKNNMYHIIDNYFGLNGELLERKEYLLKHPKDANSINEIKNILKELQIAFIDVVDYAVSSNRSASDDAIDCFCLDRDIFCKVNDNAIIICNSRNSEYAYEAMFSNKSPKYAPQQWLYKPYEDIYNKWEGVLDEYYDRSRKTWKI